MPAQSVWCVNSVYITRVSTREVRKIYFFLQIPLCKYYFYLYRTANLVSPHTGE